VADIVVTQINDLWLSTRHTQTKVFSNTYTECPKNVCYEET